MPDSAQTGDAEAFPVDEVVMFPRNADEDRWCRARDQPWVDA